ncbi:MAG: VCBS repeat-containing protein [Planctomycetota bacterium]
MLIRLNDFAIVDVNHDGILDVLGAEEAVAFVPGTGLGTFGPTVSSPGAGHYGRMAVDDLDGDGEYDIVQTEWVSGMIWFHQGAGDGTFSSKLVYDMNVGGQSYKDVQIADVNGDAVPDLVVTVPSLDVVFVFEGLGSGVLADPLVFATADKPSLLIVDDFDHNGMTDIVIQYDDDFIGITYDLLVR